MKPTGGHDKSGSEQGSGREEDHIPDTTLENQSEDDDEDTNERICMKIVSIIHDIGQTLREQENCPCEEEIDEITRNFSRISQNTVLQLSLAATIEHENAFMDSSHKSRTKQGGRDADLCSTSSGEDEEDEESESYGRSQFIDDEALEASEEVDDEEAFEAAYDYVQNDYSPDNEELEEVGNEYSGGQDTTHVAASPLNGAELASDTSFAEYYEELYKGKTDKYFEDYTFDFKRKR